MPAPTAAEPATTDAVIRSVVFAKEPSTACHRIPSIAVSPGGVLLAFSDFRTENHGDHGQRTDLVLRRSRDGGRSWLPVQTLAANPDINHHSGPVVVDRQTGRIIKFYRVWPRSARNNPTLHQAWAKDREGFLAQGFGSWFIHSDDDGATWSKPVRLHLDIPEAPGFQGIGNGIHGIQLPSGRLLVHAWAFRSQLTKHDGKTDALSLLVYSDDHGETWLPGARWSTDYAPQEITYARVGGRIYCNGRTRGPWRKATFINDPTRDRPDFTPVETHPESGCHAGLAAEGGDSLRLVFSNPPNSNHSGSYQEGLRHGLRLRLSTDGGATWSSGRVIDPGLSGYSDLAWENGRILCLYEAGPERYDNEIHFLSVDPQWITAE